MVASSLRAAGGERVREELRPAGTADKWEGRTVGNDVSERKRKEYIKRKRNRVGGGGEYIRERERERQREEAIPRRP